MNHEGVLPSITRGHWRACDLLRFWNDYIVLKVIDKKITPEEAEVIKAKMNSLDWLYDTYNVPRDQEFYYGYSLV